MEKNRLVAVTGVTGVGKDFLTERANRDFGLTALNLGTLIGERLAMDRDVMMDVAHQDRIREAQFSAYREAVARQPAIVTCHAVRLHDEELRYDWEMEQIFNPKAYVFVRANPEVIAERVRQRNARGERQSAEYTAGQIADEQAQKMKLMEELTKRLECDLVVIDNDDYRTNEGIFLLQETIGRIAAL